MSKLSISITKLSAVLNYLDKAGLKRQTVLEDLGINPTVLESPDNRLTANEVDSILKKAVEFTNNDCVGLLMGAGLSKGFSNILGYILLNCSNLSEAAEKFSKYERIVDDTSITKTTITDVDAIVSITITDSILMQNRQYSEYKMSGLLSYINLITGRKINLKEVHFIHGKPKDTSHYTHIFNCPVFFSMKENSLIFEKYQLNLPIIEPNADLLQLFEDKARETLKNTSLKDTYSIMVANTILKELSYNMPSVKMVASKLNMSVRSLQVYLKKEGTSYTQILNDIRKKISIKCLEDDRASIDEIAYITGFSEASAFHRAFKKWTGLTPNEYRNNRGHF